MTSKIDWKAQKELLATLLDPEISEDWLKLVLIMYPWNKRNTPLAGIKGPRKWQARYLDEVSDHLLSQRLALRDGQPLKIFKSATVSGRGIGKSALLAWLANGMMSSRLGSTTIVAANGEPQLKNKTMPEISKWVTLGLTAPWFDISVMKIAPKDWFAKALADAEGIDSAYYYIVAQLWSLENPDAFAGVHNPLGVNTLFDEASGIPGAIYNVTPGFFTEPCADRYWHCFSNGRRNSGPFFDSFHVKDKEGKPYWKLHQIDSRMVEGVDTSELQEIIDRYGIDSDEARKEVLGQFPMTGENQFISSQKVFEAQSRAIPEEQNHAPLVMGVDVARMGRGKSVMRWRQGRDGRSIPPVELVKLDNMALANEVGHWIQKTNPDAVCIDAGNGSGVIDRLRQLKYKVHEIHFHGSSPDPRWLNMRMYMYAEAENWLDTGCVDAHAGLFRDLTAPDLQDVNNQKDQKMLEPKEQLASRGIENLDHGDAFVLTFAVKPAWRNIKSVRRPQLARDVDYPLFSSDDRNRYAG